MRRTLGPILILSFILIEGSCVKRANSDGARARLATFPEMFAKATLQEKSSAQLPVLSLIRSTGKANLTEFVLPVAISYSSAGDLYISDNNGQTIHRWASNRYGADVFLAKNAAGLLEFPNDVQSVGDRVYISDNAGIKIFSVDGRFERLIRTYYAIFSFVITTRNTILINPIIRNADSQDPLIVELDADGKRIRGFGSRQDEVRQNGFNNRAFLAVAGSKLFVAFKYRQTIEVYDIDSGRLQNVINIEHPVLQNLRDSNVAQSSSIVSERLVSPRYVAGVRAVRNKIFVCLHLPNPEILEFDQNGRAVAHFRVPAETPAIDIFGFDARDATHNISIAIGVLEPDWNSTVYEVKVY